MPYYRFDMTFVNLTALPAGSHAISLALKIGVVGIGPNKPAAYDTLPTSGDYSISYNTATPPSGSAFELAATDPVWIDAQIFTEYTGPDTDKLLVFHSLGPYEAGQIGVEVPAP